MLFPVEEDEAGRPARRFFPATRASEGTDRRRGPSSRSVGRRSDAPCGNVLPPGPPSRFPRRDSDGTPVTESAMGPWNGEFHARVQSFVPVRFPRPPTRSARSVVVHAIADDSLRGSDLPFAGPDMDMDEESSGSNGWRTMTAAAAPRRRADAAGRRFSSDGWTTTTRRERAGGGGRGGRGAGGRRARPPPSRDVGARAHLRATPHAAAIQRKRRRRWRKRKESSRRGDGPVSST